MPTVLRNRPIGACLVVLLALLVAVLPIVTPAWAQASGPQEALVREEISEDAAVAMVREQVGGKVVRVDRKMEGGALVYHVRVLSPDGRLREFRVDANTGSIR